MNQKTYDKINKGIEYSNGKLVWEGINEIVKELEDKRKYWENKYKKEGIKFKERKFDADDLPKI